MSQRKWSPFSESLRMTLWDSPDLSDWMAKRYEGLRREDSPCDCGERHIPDRTYPHGVLCKRCGGVL